MFKKLQKGIKFITALPHYYFLLSLFKYFFREKERIIGLAGHFRGNLKYLYQELRKYRGVTVYFVTGDEKEAKDLKSKGINIYYYLDVKNLPLFVKTRVWITSTGPAHIPFLGIIRRLFPFYKLKHRTKWVDVWHGLAFKDVGRGKMLVNYNYDLAFVTSNFFKKHYAENSDILKKIKITGYPRTDPLIKKSFNREKIIRKIGIPSNRKNILYAPTWGYKRKFFFPWEKIERFIEDVEFFCEKNNCNFLIRMHPNWYKLNIGLRNKLNRVLDGKKYIFHLSPNIYKDAEVILYISDVLITDWSSIANDFILLHKPIIFLDIPSPVEKFVLTPEDRVGYIVKNKFEFFKRLQEAIKGSDIFAEQRKKLIKKLYEHLDGNSSKRCAIEVIKLLDNDGTNG